MPMIVIAEVATETKDVVTGDSETIVMDADQKFSAVPTEAGA
jgi:hypothetical protein